MRFPIANNTKRSIKALHLSERYPMMTGKKRFMKHDIVVIGAGVSGIAAAVSAAKRGSTVVLVERYGFLGGLATSAWVGTIAGAYYLTSDNKLKFTNEGFAKTFLHNLRSKNGLGEIAYYNNAVYIPYSPVVLKLVCDNFVRSEPNISLMLHAHLTDAYVKNRRIDSIVIHTKSGPVEIQGKIFIDCSGDADLSYLAGVPMQKSARLQYPSTMFLVNHVKVQKAYSAGAQKLSKLMLHAHMSGDLTIPRMSGVFFETGRPGEVIVSMTHVARHDKKPIRIDHIDDLTYGELEGRQQAIECFELLKKKMPGFESAYLADIAPQLGIRESRRIKGHYILTKNDVLSGRTFTDGIAWGAWPIELHTAAGKTEWIHLEKGARYQISYRCLCPLTIDNLLVAGRCISATHEALGSCRVIGTCLAMGEAAGIIAPLLASEKKNTSSLNGKDPRQIVQGH